MAFRFEKIRENWSVDVLLEILKILNEKRSVEVSVVEFLLLRFSLSLRDNEIRYP